MPGDLHPSLADSSTTPYWLDSPDRPAPRPGPGADVVADLCVVGGGYSGLWTAILAKERDPGRDVVLLEGSRIGWAASGRNGGFCAASITHGHANGADRWPDEIDTLDRLGRDNLDAIEATLERYGIDCDFERPGAITVATEPHQLEWLREMAAENPDATYLDQEAMRAEVSSPTFLAGVFEPRDMALVDPAKLAWGLAAAAEALGVRIHEGTHVAGIGRGGAGLDVRTDAGYVVRAGRVALGTNAFPSLVRRVRLHTVPVYDYALMTEPLSPEQLDAVGWRRTAGARRHDQPVPLLPDDPRRPDPLGRLRRDLPLRPARPPGRTTSGPRRSTCWPGSSSRRSRSWRGCDSPTAGAGRSTPAPASAPSSAPRTPGARRTPSASPGSASAPPASAPT